ncbi:hypothetical protein GCM10011344_27620 [Dokdonia pacifica]|uniref:LytTr DNA-binding domain-containing protein n=1 Tax=Dokdonia pacifica TaxID=1627892 RepID=A0A239CFQ3_9FLAO|nr:LytTR family transcriptional regulator DNA-binding domain-containing protein [Dokdonia pacifica]GGG25441.1 hypothetical protein GCM10011344_27620 [Dokdonia pacifica]SNS18508.1 LytTr DNA-binding domain-containing protein [Dokdonia pacifica]
MKKINQKKGVFVYINYLLTNAKNKTIEYLKENPKETRIHFKDVLWISTENMAKNWIKIKAIKHEKLLYENRSMVNFIRIAGKQEFCKIAKNLTVNLFHIKRKSNLAIIELTNGDTFKVNRSYRSELRSRLLMIWEE